ncbi:2Fe-2S iron-sulfur cluster-binding protein [Roseovarius sp. M141]|uniref:2Fe-2S iron-sulfur cluster-binding protein n=1 Tax=Roseovarius sp. M141 TaxID=2583806 RepID=UPI0020CBC219
MAGKGRVKHSAPFAFRFDGREFQGLQGDSVASALLENGIHLVGDSSKYHRQRGPVPTETKEPMSLIALPRAICIVTYWSWEADLPG